MNDLKEIIEYNEPQNRKNLKYNMKERIKAQFYPFLKLCNLIGVKKQENMTAINFLENISNKRKKS